MVKTAKEGIKQNATKSELYVKMHSVFVEMDATSKVSAGKYNCCQSGMHRSMSI